ncbi:MAG: hypothetical protein ACOCUV_00565 [bacterium]
MIKKKITKTITRKELYDLVWSKPIMDISKEFGISDRGLGKVCERNDIPKPPRGYWQRLNSGEKIEIPKLPKIKDKWRENIHIEGTVEVQMPDPVAKKVIEQTNEQLVIPAGLLKTHPLIKKTEKTVRKDLRHRRNLILNTLFLELEKYAYEIETEDEVFGIDAKAGASVGRNDFKNLRWFSDKAPKDKMFTGVILYTGDQVLAFGENMYLVPINNLWE